MRNFGVENVDARTYELKGVLSGYANFISQKTLEICSKATISGLFNFLKNKAEIWYLTSTKFVSREVCNLVVLGQSLNTTLVTINSFIQASGTTV